jgi:hypothetical protein
VCHLNTGPSSIDFFGYVLAHLPFKLFLLNSSIPGSILPTAPNCGSVSVSDRIIGGQEAALDEFPWLALIEYQHDSVVVANLCNIFLLSLSA